MVGITQAAHRPSRSSPNLPKQVRPLHPIGWRLSSSVSHFIIALFCTCLFILTLTPCARAGTAEASATSPGAWDDDDAQSAGATLTIETFAGVNGLPGGQLTTTYATPNIRPAARVFLGGTFGTGLFDIGSRFGPGVWTATTAKAGLTSYAGLYTSYRLAGTTLASSQGKLSFIRPGTLVAEASVAAGARNSVRAGAYAKDPIPVPTGSYSYDAMIGGTAGIITDGAGDLSTTPTSLQVDPGQIATIEWSADDSNDPSYLTTESDPIWDFAITLDGTGSTPVLSASFEDDPTRISIPGGPTSPGQDQAFANALLGNLLSDTTDVSLTGVGSFGETLDLNNAVKLFSGTYLDAASSPAAMDPDNPGAVDFEYGAGAGVVDVPEPAIGPMILILTLAAARWASRRDQKRRAAISAVV